VISYTNRNPLIRLAEEKCTKVLIFGIGPRLCFRACSAPIGQVTEPESLRWMSESPWMDISPAQLFEALEQCDFVTHTSEEDLLADPSLSCRTESNRFMSTSLAIVRRLPSGTYVIFRGTESLGLGTWLITNFQVASAEFRAVDKELEHRGACPELRIQGAKSKVIAPGRVHQGFLRTWSQLWYDSDIPNTTFFNPLPAAVLAKRYLSVAILVALFSSLFFSLQTIIMLPLIAVLGIMALESGSLERLFWKGTLCRKGPAIRQSILDSPPVGPVWFVGHSLGGALATLSFIAYCNHFRNDKYTAYLVTFGSPRVGDDAFVKDFEARYEGQCVHVADKSDPVPLSPPPRPGKLIGLAGAGLLGLSGLLLMVASIFWASLYPWLWRGRHPYADWSNRLRLGGSHNWITAPRHFLKSYRKRLSQHFRQSL
jgi:hypothetical protein